MAEPELGWSSTGTGQKTVARIIRITDPNGDSCMHKKFANLPYRINKLFDLSFAQSHKVAMYLMNWWYRNKVGVVFNHHYSWFF